MTLQIAILFAVIAIGLILFTTEWIAIEITALGMVLALAVTGILSPADAFAGFGSETVIMMLGILILTATLARTGVSDVAARILLQRSEGISSNRLVALVMGLAASFSSFIGNTATAAFFLPVVLGISRRKRISPSVLLMPLAFAAILASSVSLISTSTNVIVNGLMQQRGLAPMGMFELAPVGIPIMVVGIGYMLLVGRRLAPDRVPLSEVEEGPTHQLYFTELVLPSGSPMAGRTLGELDIMHEVDVAVLRVVRGKDRMLVPGRDIRLEAGDSLLVEGPREAILHIQGSQDDIAIKPEYKFSSPDVDTGDIELAEVLLLPGCSLVGRTLKGIRFRQQYGLQVLAIEHQGKRRAERLADIRLSAGDVLLIQGDRGRINALAQEWATRLLDRLQPTSQSRDRRPIAVGIFLGALVLATFNVLPLSVAMLGGSVLAFITRCITPEEAYTAVQWPIIFLIGSMLGVGVAMEQTGAAQFLANGILSLLPADQPLLLLSAFFALTVVLTQPMSNQAAAVIVFPVAMATAIQLGVNPRTFAMMIAVAASTSFITPLEPACLLVFGPGRYKFFDFVRVGFPLTVVIYGLAIWLVPLIWPL